MKALTKLLLLASISFSFNCYAEKVPFFMLDQASCQLKSGHNLGGCYKNMTGEDLDNSGLYFRQTIEYSDRHTPIASTPPFGLFHAGRYIVISTSGEVIKKNFIKKVSDEISNSSSTHGGVLPGCHFELAGEGTMQQLMLVKSGNGYRCIQG